MAPEAAGGGSDGLRALGLDDGFIQRVLVRARTEGEEFEADEEEKARAPDYDVYLMEQGVMPLLLQGLDALSRHVDKCGQGGTVHTGSRVPFNPLTWLAQYLLRNHPGKVKDGRAKMYQRLAELANIERGRRNLLRKRPEMEDEWLILARDRPLGREDVLIFAKRLDERWNLEGQFSQLFPLKVVDSIPASGPSGEVTFDTFWTWFEARAREGDLLRASAFEIAARRREEAIRRAQELEEERRRHAAALQEIMEVRRGLEDQFASLCADLYTNEVVTQIINKGAVIQGIVEVDGGPPLSGEHIELIIAMLRVWGYQADSMTEDVWDEASLAAWQQWMEEQGPKGGSMQVDSVNLRYLMDRDAFEGFLGRAYPLPELDLEDDEEQQRTVAVEGLFIGEGEEDAGMYYVEAVDEATGQRKQLLLPSHYIEEVQQRLAQGSGQPLLARIDVTTQRLTSIVPSGAAADT